MKKYKTNITSLAIAVFIVLSPLAVLAKNSACDAISNIYTKIEERITAREAQVKEIQTNIGAKYTEKIQNRETAIKERRDKWDENRGEHFTKLGEKAQTDEQKQAVAAFVKTVTIAVKDRRAAFDKAILDFQKGVGVLYKSRTTVLAGAIATYKTDVKSAFDKASQDCGSDVAIKTVRSNLRNDLKDVRDQYREDVKSFGGQGTEIQKLVEAKKQAMNKAKDDFKTILEQALATLKAVFPEADSEADDVDLKQACLDSGGTIAESSCCKATKNYPNLCLIGACGCSSENSKQVKTCDCGTGKCFNGTACVAQ